MARPDLIPVDSEAIESLGYDAAEQELYVRFRGSDGTYVYSGVTADEYGALQQAESLGAHVNREIKPRHPYRLLDSDG